MMTVLMQMNVSSRDRVNRSYETACLKYMLVRALKFEPQFACARAPLDPRTLDDDPYSPRWCAMGLSG